MPENGLSSTFVSKANHLRDIAVKASPPRTGLVKLIDDALTKNDPFSIAQLEDAFNSISRASAWQNIGIQLEIIDAINLGIGPSGSERRG